MRSERRIHRAIRLGQALGAVNHQPWHDVELGPFTRAHVPMYLHPALHACMRLRAGHLLPTVLFLLRPTTPAVPRVGGSSGSAAASSSTQARGAAPAGMPGPRQAASSAGAPALVLPASGPLPGLIRAALALLIRSCSAPDPQHNYLALSRPLPLPAAALPVPGAGISSAPEVSSRAWQRQAWQVLQLCCRLVAAPRVAPAQPHGAQAPPASSHAPPDPVISAAALRLAVLLTDCSAWKFLPPGAASAAGGHARPSGSGIGTNAGHQ